MNERTKLPLALVGLLTIPLVARMDQLPKHYEPHSSVAPWNPLDLNENRSEGLDSETDKN